MIKNSVAIYTSIVGDYDLLREPPDLNCDFICFTDDRELTSHRYEMRYITQTDLDAGRESRRYKVLPHIHLSQYRYTIWIDAAFSLKEGFDLSGLLAIMDQHDLAFIKHPFRDCLYDEYEECVRLKKDDKDLMKNQVDSYRESGYPKNNGLLSGGFIIRDNHAPAVKEFNELWWREIMQHSKRDQLSLMFALHTLEKEVYILDIPYFDNDFVMRFNHKHDQEWNPTLTDTIST